MRYLQFQLNMLSSKFTNRIRISLRPASYICICTRVYEHQCSTINKNYPRAGAHHNVQKLFLFQCLCFDRFDSYGGGEKDSFSSWGSSNKSGSWDIDRFESKQQSFSETMSSKQQDDR